MSKHKSFERLRYLILAAQREGDRRLNEALEQMGLTTSQAEVLRVLQDFSGLSLRELGERLICERGSPSRLVKTLTRSNLVISTADPDDGRSMRIRLSSRGLRLATQIQAIEAAFYDALQEVLSAKAAASVADNLERLLEGSSTYVALFHRRLVRSDDPHMNNPTGHP